MDKFNQDFSGVFYTALLEALDVKIKDVVYTMVMTDPMVLAVMDIVKRDIVNSVNTCVDTLVKERIGAAVKDALTKATLQAEMKMAENISNIELSIIKDVQNHIMLRDSHFQNFDGLLESACVDAGEDSLGAGGPLTDLINVAHALNDGDVKTFEGIVKRLKEELSGESVNVKEEGASQ
ncbi:hypothetical protein AUEXF2481DRAFT_602786 [Aureobasidium subglaciale EXF-2481]|uniref:Uncharacterized protein n=1 Tax=Aureobasidium subglaciale (strain EXF-2481) TaxID=1043005 RepID=A0A074YTP2_AURSE|nr:uncharacterized protein AUEXF2481DRAFT_602786 [Aureobasidium subglaciale EXF-2481]KAI5195005.1 hypothetical protein E4T38_09298 [Aureobasidium subglaciale]KAI5214092.1 hypothetical protein E4T40_09249 [Aureobasidium subglaciale]KAI5216500.1 hypothetical protein E4T41_09250 [Aureobasidium subglaciale]KAI5254419.1 hypothetical protein E4T46_09205 [Aureobasidium subglaciale]KEQ97507.1 hypothetical protein AUEXF2481DRAFT_602786 [Aureobasidium subglaciale EXF-2481]